MSLDVNWQNRQGGCRHRGGMNLIQALVRNLGTCRADVKGAIQVGSPHKNLSTEAAHRGGSACSSEEVSVMEMERRGWHVQNRFLVNSWEEELIIYANLVLCKGHEEPYEARVSSTVLWEAEGEVPSAYSTSVDFLDRLLNTFSASDVAPANV